MNTIKLMIVTLCMVIGASALSAQTKKDTKEAEVTFKTSIECHSCEQKIKKNIPFEKGVKDVSVNVEKKEVTIKYRTDKTDKEKLQKAIEKLGYTCEEITPISTTAALSKPSCCAHTSSDAKPCTAQK